MIAKNTYLQYVSNQFRNTIYLQWTKLMQSSVLNKLILSTFHENNLILISWYPILFVAVEHQSIFFLTRGAPKGLDTLIKNQRYRYKLQ